MTTKRVLDHLDANHGRILEELKEFAAIPSVSTDPAYAADMRSAAAWVANALSSAGPFSVQTIETRGILSSTPIGLARQGSRRCWCTGTTTCSRRIR